MKSLLPKVLGLLLLATAVVIAVSRAPDRPVQSLVARWGAPPSDFIEVNGQVVHVRDVGPRWRVCARDSEGLVEGIELEGDSFVLGVQWHPELAPEGTAHDRLFRALVFAAAQRSIARRYPQATAQVGT